MGNVLNFHVKRLELLNLAGQNLAFSELTNFLLRHIHCYTTVLFELCTVALMYIHVL
mgnify:CR=1 FL=1